MPPKRTTNIPSGNPQDSQIQFSQEQEANLQINDESLQKNNTLLKRIRTYGALNSGILAGIFGMSGGQGFLFYILMFFVVSALIWYKGGFKLNNYFLTQNDALSSGLANDITLFLMIWVISHNMVNIL